MLHSGVVARLPERYGTRPAVLVLLAKSSQFITAAGGPSINVTLTKINGCITSEC